jgi:phenylacetate-CoA ligase
MGLLEQDKQPAVKETKMQEEKLQELLQYVSQHSPFYKELFATHQVDISAIKTLADLLMLIFQP